METSERIQQLEQLIDQLREVNREIPVIVEGDQDVRCLRALGLTGSILKVHTGKTLYEFGCDLSARYPGVILLMDWDRNGQKIHEQLVRDLEAEWLRHDPFRQGLKQLCHPDIQEVEQVCGYLEKLRRQEKTPHQEHRPCP